MTSWATPSESGRLDSCKKKKGATRVGEISPCVYVSVSLQWQRLGELLNFQDSKTYLSTNGKCILNETKRIAQA